MKQTLSLRLGQQLTMTPQLQQAIRLLQLSSLDLQQEIQTALESNPMLEMEDGEQEEDLFEPDNTDPGLAGTDTGATTQSGFDDPDDDSSVDQSWDEPIPEDLPVDTQWDDIYQGAAATSGPAPDDDWDPDARNETPESLQDHLLWQLNLVPLSDIDRTIGATLIDAIDANGMLCVSIDEIVESLGPYEADETPIEADEVLAVLKLIQQFDPVGVGARDLGECLALQLRQLPAATPWRSEALAVVSEHLELLGARDFATLKRRTRLSEEDLAEVIGLIQTLNPRPGTSVAEEASEYVVPDVLVSKSKGRWVVELNEEALPRLRINPLYAGMVKRADNSADNTYLKDNLQEARWFLKSLQSRNETLLKVATKIVEHQRGFLEYGEEAMKPLVLHDIAEAVGMHESTISRVTNRKYMHTPRGIFELKYFFSSHVSTHTGGEVSSTAIRALIKKLTVEENPRKPLSDNKIAAILAKQNINVARRTVAKYRESMSIPPSNERKRLV
ncbi:MAG: RNA polymerase factor sigma-54 [Pseudomonadales bacterium]